MIEFIIVLKQDAIMCARLTQHLMIGMEEVAHSQSALLSWLNSYNVKRVKVILDLPEEELYVDRHPSLYPWEMKSYAQRQQQRRFPSSVYARHLYTQAPKLPWQAVSGELWQSGFNEQDIIQKLLGWLNNAEVAVESLHSSMSILKTMMLRTWFSASAAQKRFQQQASILLVRVAEQDFRQLLIVDGHVRTNRQIHVDAKESSEQMRLLIQEVNLLDKFAKTQKLVNQEVRLQFFYVARESEDKQQAIQAFQKSSFAESSPTSHFSDMQSLIADVHLFQLYDRLLVLTLSSARLPTDYRPKIVQQVQAIQQSALALWLLWGVSVLSLMGYGLSYLTHQHETEQAMQQLAQLKQEQQDYIARYMSYYDLPLLNSYAVEDVKKTVDTWSSVQQLQKKQDILLVLAQVSQVLAQQKSIHLVELIIFPTIPKVIGGVNASKIPIDLALDKLTLKLVLYAPVGTKLFDVLAQVENFVILLNQSGNPFIHQAILVKKPLDLDSTHPLKLSLDDNSKISVIPIPFEVVVSVAYE